MALLDRRLGKIFAVSAFAMHLGIRYIMGIKFRYNQSGVMYLSFLPLGRQLVR